MASRDLNDLTPQFKAKAEKLLEGCAQRGIIMKPTCTQRDPWEQARLYRQSRTSAKIAEQAAWLRGQGAEFLSDCLMDVGPQSGKLGVHVTKVLPGQSWHQWGEAIDCYWEITPGTASWDIDEEGPNGQNGYRVYNEVAIDVGLFPAGINWGWDWPHIQMKPVSNPAKIYSWDEIDEEMKKLYNDRRPG